MRRLGLLALPLLACSSPPSVSVDAAVPGPDQQRDRGREALAQPSVVVQVEASLPAWVAPRLEELLEGSTTSAFLRLPPDADPPPLAEGSLVLAVGRTRASERLIKDSEVDALGPDGYLVRAGKLDGGALLIAVRGKEKPEHYGRKVNRGTLHGAYAALEELGFAFLHPLAPVRPRALRTPPAALELRASPRWPVRGLHLHTMHPLELTDLLNGWGPAGTGDAAGFQQGLAGWRLVCEWFLANGQNLVEWVLLGHQSWSGFSESSERQQRLAKLVEIAHEHGLAAGADVSLALTQQHSFRLVQQTGTLDDEKAQIRARADWLLGAGFDFISTENATSEFTAGDDKKMLAWMDELATHLKSRGKKAHIKIHCSQGLTAPSFTDPRTGQPLNFNFLPHYAVPELGVLPHTVQHYGLDDPAPTYANQDFGFVHDFLKLEAGRREVFWHPETAYWVSFDVDVPLFLPLYAERRLHDLRLIAADEEAGRLGRGPRAGSRIDGQIFFSSGWEWGYWLNDVVAARAAFDPELAAASDGAALRALLRRSLRGLGEPAQVAALAELVSTIAEDQHRLLILGEVSGVKPAAVEQRNGQAYLQGWESFDDLGWMMAGVPGLPKMQTQPNKLGLVAMRNPLHGGPNYTKEVRPLLAAMSSTLTGHAEALEKQVLAEAARPILDELVDAARLTALRARQVLGLYDYVDGLDLLGRPSTAAKKSLEDARLALDAARLRVAAREKSYRVPADRIAGWRPNPTAYPFGYLWTVRTLHFLWRDEAKAVKAPSSPCFMNIMSPADIAFGEGFFADNASLIAKLLNAVGLGSAVGECLTGPTTEPTYPPAGLRP